MPSFVKNQPVLLLSVPLFIISVGVVFPGRLLKPDVCQHVPHNHQESIDLLIQLPASLSHLPVLQPGLVLHNRAGGS